MSSYYEMDGKVVLAAFTGSCEVKEIVHNMLSKVFRDDYDGKLVYGDKVFGRVSGTCEVSIIRIKLDNKALVRTIDVVYHDSETGPKIETCEVSRIGGPFSDVLQVKNLSTGEVFTTTEQ